MKKKAIITLTLILVFTMCFGLTGCGNNDNDGTEAKKTIILAHTMAEDTCFGAMTDAFKEKLDESGLFDLQIYPAAQLGSENESIQAMQNGSITIFPTYTGSYSAYTAPCYVFDRMFSYDDIDVARAVLDDEEFFNIFAKEMEAYNVKVLDFADMGFRKVTSNKKVETKADLKGLIIRTIENPIHMEVWRNVGANPTPVAFTELYSALQQGVAEAQENTVEVSYSAKVYEQQKYIIDANHLLHPIMFGMNLDFWNSLTEEEQKVVQEATEYAAEKTREATDSATEKYYEIFDEAGCEHIGISDELREDFREAAVSSWEMVKEKVSPQLYEAYVTAIERAETQSAN